MSGPKAILFDKDGTLFDFQRTWAAWTAGRLRDLAAGNADQLTAFADVVGLDLTAERFVPGGLMVAAPFQQVCAALRRVDARLTDDRIRQHFSSAAVEMVPVSGLARTLTALGRAGFHLGIATNDNRASTDRQLKHAGIAAHFSFVAGCDSGFGAKPAPGQCLAFAEAAGLPAGQVVMVGDSLHDMHAGQSAGMQTVGVLTGAEAHENLAPYSQAVLPDISHLPAYLGL